MVRSIGHAVRDRARSGLHEGSNVSLGDPSTKGLHTAEFAGEFEAHTLRLLKKRFTFFCAFGAIFGLVVTSVVLVVMLFTEFSGAKDAVGVLPKLWGAIYNTAKAMGTSVVPIVAYAASLLYVLKGKVKEQALLRMSQYLVFGVGAFHFFVSGFDWATSIGWLEASLLLFFACVLLPWSAHQAMMVAGALVAAHLVSMVLQGRNLGLADALGGVVRAQRADRVGQALAVFAAVQVRRHSAALRRGATRADRRPQDP
jgi:hypothetical protein